MHIAINLMGRAGSLYHAFSLTNVNWFARRVNNVVKQHPGLICFALITLGKSFQACLANNPPDPRLLTLSIMSLIPLAKSLI